MNQLIVEKGCGGRCPDVHWFGASYVDAGCIDGYLWDLDSCDEPKGPLFSGGDTPCPFCNRAEFEKDIAEDLYSEGKTRFQAKKQAKRFTKRFVARYA